MILELRGALTPAIIDRGWGRRRLATGVRWIEVAFGLLYVAMWLTDPSDVLLIVLGVLGVLLLTGRFLPLYRRAFSYRRNPTLFESCTETVTDEGIAGSSATSTWSHTWDHWQSRLVFDDMVLLFTTPRGNAAMTLLPRSYVSTHQDWQQLVDLVTSRVAPQPRRFGLPRVVA